MPVARAESYFRRFSECPCCLGNKTPWQEYCYSCQTSAHNAALKERRGTRLKMLPGECIYAVSVAGMDHAPIKFGYTVDITKRLSSLQTGSPLQLGLLAADAGTRGNERFIHKALASYRTHGEWFKRTDLVMSLVEAMSAKQLLQWVELAKSNHQRVV